MSMSAHSAHSRVAAALACAIAALSVVAVHAYVTWGAKWTDHQVLYYVNPANLDVPEGDAEAAVRAGADAWSLQSNADFAFVYGGRTRGSTATYNGLNEVFFRNDSNGSTIATTYTWHDGAGHLLDADIVFYDGAFLFYTGASGCTGSGIYIEDPAAHEFGHALGLTHTSVAGATMTPSTSYCSTNWRTLETDDVAGVEALYPPVGTAPAAPSGAVGAADSAAPATAINVRWQDNATNEDNYYVERSTDGVSWLQVARLASSTTSYTDSGLASSRAYSYRVRASNAAGFSGYSNVATASTAAAPTAPPSAPASPSPASGITNVRTSVNLRWTCSGAESYTVYFGPSSTPLQYATGLTSPSLAVSGLKGGTTYYWRVVATNPNGSTSSSVWKFTTKAVRTK